MVVVNVRTPAVKIALFTQPSRVTTGRSLDSQAVHPIRRLWSCYVKFFNSQTPVESFSFCQHTGFVESQILLFPLTAEMDQSQRSRCTDWSLDVVFSFTWCQYFLLFPTLEVKKKKKESEWRQRTVSSTWPLFVIVLNDLNLWENNLHSIILKILTAIRVVLKRRPCSDRGSVTLCCSRLHSHVILQRFVETNARTCLFLSCYCAS